MLMFNVSYFFFTRIIRSNKIGSLYDICLMQNKIFYQFMNTTDFVIKFEYKAVQKKCVNYWLREWSVYILYVLLTLFISLLVFSL